MKYLDIKLLDPQAQLPTRGSEGSAGLDLYAVHSATVYPMNRQKVMCGIACAIPRGMAGLVLPRSGMADKHGITILNAPGLIDSDYRGEWGVLLYNTSVSDFRVEEGDRIAQLLVVHYEHMVPNPVKALPETLRGEGGFGSTGE